MRMFMRKLILQILVLCIIGLTIQPTTVHADDERTAFGSEFYQWELHSESPIGIYAYATQGIQTTDIQVQYEVSMLRYESGGELLEPGFIRIQSNAGGVAQHQQMLHFTPLVAGQTQLVIEESSMTDVYGEVYTTPIVTAPIQIALPESWQVSEMQLNGIAIADFQMETSTYRMEVSADVEQVDISVAPSDLNIELSQTALESGNNTVYALLTNAAGEQVRYTLQINRAESDITENEEGAPADEEAQDVETQVMMQGNHTDEIARRNQILLYVLLIALLVILSLLIIVKLRMAKQNHTRKKKQESEEVFQIIEWDEEELQEDLRTDVVIEVNRVVMDFRRERDEATSLKEHFIRTVKGQHSYDMFRALDDVSFRIRAGEVVGIIGTNGSGKSTILKIISGVLTPTSGSVKVDKSKIQLLTLGTGFDMELTGKENVYLNGALIGYTKEYIDEKYDEIVEFAELEGFMEEKVRNYSSGMVSRLGFAIATIRNTPEILILDEVLSVGDMFFRKKSTKRIKEMIHGGSTVLIVSHSTATIQENCTKAVWIEKGKLMESGAAETVCNAYEKLGVEN